MVYNGNVYSFLKRIDQISNDMPYTLSLVHVVYPGSIARDMSKNEGMELTMFVDADKNNLTFEFLERYDMGMEYIIRK